MFLVEAAATVCLFVALVTWMSGNAGTRAAHARRAQKIDALLRAAARRFGGRVTSAAEGREPELHFEICGAPAVVRSEPGRDHARCVLRVDLSCLCSGAVALKQLVRWWRRFARADGSAELRALPPWLRRSLDRNVAGHIVALRRHRLAGTKLSCDGGELRIAVGRIATARRIADRVEFARQLTSVFLLLASAVPGHTLGAYRS